MSPAASRVTEALRRHKGFLDFEAGGLGDDLIKAFTDGVLGCIVGEHSPDGTRWDDLSKTYAEAKARKHPGRPMAVLDFHMAKPDQVAGVPDVTTSEASVTLGTDDRARDEAEWFQEGDPARNRPPRPFWGFTPASEKQAEAILTERYRRVVR